MAGAGTHGLSVLGVLLIAFVVAVCSQSMGNNYRMGAGIYDVTGPVAQVNFMGMGQTYQRGEGLHFRLRSRAFVIEDVASSKRIVFVSNDLCMTFGGMMQNLTAKLQSTFGDLYTYDNIMVSGTHTHSGPAGFTYMTVYDLTSFGFHAGNFEAIVDGIYNAIVMAHNNLSEGGSIYINNGTLLDTSINRSEYSYYKNPPEEVAKYPYDTDKNITVLRLEDQNGNEIGMINWFAVHGTSMNNKNKLVSGDNKGYASYNVELTKNGNKTFPGLGPFVAIFGQSNEGDVTPNTHGAWCNDGTPCDARTSTCPGKNGIPLAELCNGRGPGEDNNNFESCRIIGGNQAQMAIDLYDAATTQLQGPIAYVHTFVNMEGLAVSGEYTTTGNNETTCYAALGDAFAGGTTDGPGDFNFHQGTNTSNPNTLWNELSYLVLSRPTQQQMDCQYPKPILLNTGNLTFPAPWTASIVPLQIFRIGQLFIIGVPGEFTTMAGRRLRDTVRSVLVEYGAADENSYIVIAGLSNEYTHYITTWEEYQIQRYEAGSTLYGPHTLAAYQQEYASLAMYLATNQSAPVGPSPPDLSYIDWCLLECDRLPDSLPDGVSFGDVATQPDTAYIAGDVANCTFYGANPQNNYMTQSTYLTVDMLQSDGSWETLLVDGHWDTKFHWKANDLDQSMITVEWDIADDTPAGTYRLTHQGYYKHHLTGKLEYYSGTSDSFTVSSS